VQMYEVGNPSRPERNADVKAKRGVGAVLLEYDPTVMALDVGTPEYLLAEDATVILREEIAHKVLRDHPWLTLNPVDTVHQRRGASQPAPKFVDPVTGIEHKTMQDLVDAVAERTRAEMRTGQQEEGTGSRQDETGGEQSGAPVKETKPTPPRRGGSAAKLAAARQKAAAGASG